jgi:pyruvate-ferredoxin/flavodoxin oxidoreductase
MLASANAQEVMGLGVIAHLTALKARLPVIHFFDGFRTSHEYQKIRTVDYEDVGKLLDLSLVRRFRDRALSPEHPVIRGTAQNPDIYFQGREAQNRFFEQVTDIVGSYMDEFEKVTGRKYRPFDYYGDPDAERIIIAMGSVCDVIEETVDHLRGEGQKVGSVKVHLYRPFPVGHLLEAVPKTVKKIAVLDRTKEPGATGEPLYLDMVRAFSGAGPAPVIVGGRYGLGSKDTRPSQIISVFDNLAGEAPKDGFTIGINDDVTYKSLPESGVAIDAPEGTVSCKLWGLGSDGTVGANKSAIRIIGNHTDLYVQGYFSYDSKKSGGCTVSRLRFGRNPIKSHYLVYEADYIACHNKSFVFHLDVLKGIKENGIFVLNCDWSQEELERELPAGLKRTIAEKNINFYTIDALAIAREIGLGNRINMIMQAAFFRLLGIIPVGEAVKHLKESISAMYGKKGRRIVEANMLAVDRGIDSLKKIDVPASWLDAVSQEENPEAVPKESPADNPVKDKNSFFSRIQRKMARHEGDELPVSAFEGMEDGSFPLGTTAFEKRGIAVMIPEWQIDNCIECGFCSLVCPHATIRLFFLDEEEQKRAPATFKTREAGGKGLENYRMRVQVSPYDCTGCGNCADVCPPKEKALVMKPADIETENEADNWEFAITVTPKEGLFPKNTVKGSQLFRPLLEFSGACPGCGETPYIKLITQLFGERKMIANATGCSSIWGASAPSMAYTTNAEGKGPAWANSLFEDNAEYGYGMYLGVRQVRNRIADLMRKSMEAGIPEEFGQAFMKWIEYKEHAEGSKEASAEILRLSGETDPRRYPYLSEILELKDYLVKRSVWIIGGDGGAYDIGCGGLDQVLAMGDDVNILVMDTEIYSNTGGQSSKSTPASAVAKFAAKGKRTRKKDLGRMAITYGHVYVGSIALGADYIHAIKTIIEAEAYPGPSLIIAYSPCVSHGIRTDMGTSIQQEKRAVDSGYWYLYRYNPLLIAEGKNPFILDSKDPKIPYIEFLNSEIRFTALAGSFPAEAEKLFEISEKHAAERLAAYKHLGQVPRST